MKKIGTLNQPISAMIAGLGHTDTVVIADAGLPIPAGPQRIDLALTQSVPTLLQTLDVILTEMQVEKVVIAEEMLAVSPEMHTALIARLDEIPVETISHEDFKRLTQSAKAIIRTGEFTPYANIILSAGVVF